MPNFKGVVPSDTQASPLGTIFAPENKYSPVKVTHLDGWANGSDDSVFASHDASAGAVPSYTTAKRGSFCIATVAGTLGGRTVALGDILVAQNDSPTTASQWAIVADSTAEIEAALEAGEDPVLFGTFKFKAANPDARLRLKGDFTLMNECGYTAIYQTANTTYADANSPETQCSALTAATATDPYGLALNLVSRFTLTTLAHASRFKMGQMVKVVCDTPTVSTAALSGKAYITSSAKVQYVDEVSGYVYADRIIRGHTAISAATNIYLVPLTKDRASYIDGMLMMGAPTIIGESVGWWMTLFGDTVSGTISGSGGTRTITRAGHNMKVDQIVRLSGTTSSTVLSVTSSTFVVDLPTYEDQEVASANVPVNIPTSGSIDYEPVFNCSEFDSTTHGAHTILNHANGSFSNITQSRLWAKGLSHRFSDFCVAHIESFGPQNNPMTSFDNNITSGRLTYNDEEYGGSNCRLHLEGIFQRHARTGNRPTTTSAWAATHWLDRQGTPVDNVLHLQEHGSSGGADTHDDEDGFTCISEHYNNTMSPLNESYRPFIGNDRSSNETRRHIQRGGYEGLVLRAVERVAGSIANYELDVKEIPYASSSQTGFRTESHASKTNRPTVVGTMNFQNAGIGSKWDSGVTSNLRSYQHTDIGKRGMYLLGYTKFGANVVNLDFFTNTSGQSTRNCVYMEDNAIFQANILNVTLGEANNPAAIFEDGDNETPVTYTASTIAFVNSNPDTITDSANGFVSSGFKIGQHINVTGASTAANNIVQRRIETVVAGTITLASTIALTAESAGASVTIVATPKTVRLGVLNVMDPFKVGMPPLITAGREANVNLDIGDVFYNGNRIIPVTVVSATTYTIKPTDRVINTTSGSAVTITVPRTLMTQSAIEIIQSGAGTVTFAAGTGATINSYSSLLSLAGQHAAARIYGITNTDGITAVVNLAGNLA